MPDEFSIAHGQKNLLIWLGRKASEELKVLLETKHLYQKVDIHPGEITKTLYKQVYQTQQQEFATWAKQQLPREKFGLAPHRTALTPRSLSPKLKERSL